MQIVAAHDHPNRDEIVRVVGSIVTLEALQLGQIAQLYTDGAQLQAARDLALGPEVPELAELFVVLDMLSTVRATAGKLGAVAEVTAYLGADMVTRAFAGLADAVAGAYARPMLPDPWYTDLLRPWRLTVGWQ